jgi:hypothetical protein
MTISLHLRTNVLFYLFVERRDVPYRGVEVDI